MQAKKVPNNPFFIVIKDVAPTFEIKTQTEKKVAATIHSSQPTFSVIIK